MAKTISSKISDPRPRINITMTSDDDKSIAQLTKGFVNLQRGPKTAILRVPFGELAGVIDLLTSAQEALSENGYDTSVGSEEPIAAPTTRTRGAKVPDDASSLEQPVSA